MTEIAAVGVLLGVIALWNFGAVAVLRSLGFRLAFSVPFRFYPRKRRELLQALQGESRNTFVFISGFLFFAFPFLAGTEAYHYVLSRYIDHKTHGASSVTGFVLSFLVVAIAGTWFSIRDYENLRGNRGLKS